MMFPREITNTTFAGDIADEMFPNIRGSNFRHDCSMLATMRAVLNDRISPEEHITLRFSSSSYTSGAVKDASISTAIETMLDLDPSDCTDFIVVHSLDNDENNNSEILEYLKDKFTDKYKGYKEIEDLRVFVKKLMNSCFFIDEESRMSIILIDRLTYPKMHMLQALLPRLLPWFFKDREPINDEVKALLSSLTKNSAVDYRTLIEQMASKIDFRECKIKKLLKGFDHIFEQRQLDDKRRWLEAQDERLRQLEEEYAYKLREKVDAQIVVNGLLQKLKEDGEDEIMNYFLCNQTLHLQEVRGTEIIFIVESYLDEYDPEIFARYIKNERSVFYESGGSRYSNSDINLLLTAIFGDEPCLKIKICAAYSLDVGGMSARGLSGYDFPAAFENCLPNQHIQRHSCLGNNGQYISKCLAEHNYITAIEQCVYSARNFNMGDSIVSRNFMEKIFASSAKRFIELPDGSICTPIKALEWLKANKEEEAERE